MKDIVDGIAGEFSSESHGSSDLWKGSLYVQGKAEDEFVPIEHLFKKHENLNKISDLQAHGYVVSSLTYLELNTFDKWYQKTFNRKLTQKEKKLIDIIHYPDTKKVHEAVEIVDQVYRILKDHKILVNGKNLPVQLGEWYAKSIFGLHQKKSSSQRGFDFYTEDEKKVEVKIHWHDITSPKGVKLKRSLVEMSEYTVIMYIAKNFTIRDVLLLDSDFVIRKFAGKGHTIFLKDSDVAGYFFSRSNKHYGRIINRGALMKFATPDFAMKVDEKSE
ncbi:MAG: hypothetical protein CME65_04055 [Halobacteriovoraceae bacterium]|nr:hypothetical protein [Halobacteriovoraceae bacterium]